MRSKKLLTVGLGGRPGRRKRGNTSDFVDNQTFGANDWRFLTDAGYSEPISSCPSGSNARKRAYQPFSREYTGRDGWSFLREVTQEEMQQGIFQD